VSRRLIFLVILCTLAWSNAQAREGVSYILPKITAMVFDDNPQWRKPLYTVGAFYGYGLDNNLSGEIEGNYGFYGGDYTSAEGNGSFSYWDVAVYGAYRYPVLTEGYLKLKAGAVYMHSEHLRPAGAGTRIREGLELQLGAGLGYVFKSKITLELEYTRLKNNANNAGVALHYPF